MIACTRLLTLLGAVLLSGCAATFTTTWKDPAATPLEFKGQKVAAVVLLKDQSSRKLAEDRLAQQIAVRGAQGRPLYSLLPGVTGGNEQQARAALEAEGVKGVIVMQPISVDRNARITQPYQEASYASFWGGRSKTTNPETLAALIQELTTATTAELKKAGLIKEQ